MRRFLPCLLLLLALPPRGAAGSQISSPPTLLGSVATPGDAFDVVLRDHYALVPSYDAGIQVVDIADPTAPVIVASHDTPGYSVQCVLWENQLFVADHAAGGLRILNITNPLQPVPLGSLVTGDAVLGVGASNGLALAGYVSGGFDVVDVTVPAQPVVESTVPTQGSPRHFIARDNRLYVADHGAGVRIYDIATISSPQLLDTLAFFRPTGLDLVANTLYVADFDGLHVVDVADPADPVALGDTALPGPAIKVHVVDGYAFVADHVAGGLQVVDVADPGHPIPVTGFATGFYAHGIAVRAPYAYLADGAGLKVFRVFEAPVAVEESTIGGLKARFRGNEE
ncbi:MAG TPA: hypothetical protein VFX92_12875 [Candidatus Krumholzibacteria bacterium]|nr:hypothetical protein [Candidatus Krumholzibacteria bacterium]